MSANIEIGAYTKWLSQKITITVTTFTYLLNQFDTICDLWIIISIILVLLLL